MSRVIPSFHDLNEKLVSSQTPESIKGKYFRFNVLVDPPTTPKKPS